jgi:hypothetical protein
MKRAGIQELLWMYSDFVLLFKRSFEGIWPLWLQLNCSPHPNNWLPYFVCAVVVLSFNHLKGLPTVTITTLMEAFPRILETIELKRIGMAALWIAEHVPPHVESATGSHADQSAEFKFFEAAWTSAGDSKSGMGGLQPGEPTVKSGT